MTQQGVLAKDGKLIRFKSDPSDVDRRVVLYVKSPDGVPMLSVGRSAANIRGVQITEAEFLELTEKVKAEAKDHGMSYLDYIQNHLQRSA